MKIDVNPLVIGRTFLAGIIGVTLVIISRYMFKKLLSKKSCHSNSTVLQGDTPVTIQVLEKTNKTHNVISLRFKLDYQHQILGLPIGKYVCFTALINNTNITRKYTPVSIDHVDESINFIIKVYKRNENPKFPNGGIMTQYLDQLKPGDHIQITGPYGLIHYLGDGKFEVKQIINQVEHTRLVESSLIGMIAGGSGITPMLQLIRAITIDTNEQIKLKLLFANREYKDIILKDDFDQLKQDNKNFDVHYILSDPPSDGWSMSVGQITKDIIQSQMPPASIKPIILICGPPPMVSSMKKLLVELAYDNNYVISF